ncbi:MAG: Lrp/AsnC ligand binding domain-containing protein [Candidatus Hodarchaeota archaeon]
MSSEVVACLLLVVKMGKEHEVAEKIKRIEDVVEVLIVYGQWDVLIRIETEALGKLDYIVTEIRRIDGVEQTTTLIAS